MADTPAISLDKTTIAPEVLVTIARLSALEVDGVARMAPVPGGVNRLFRRGANDGVQIEMQDDCVQADLYVVIAANKNVRAVSRAVQEEVTRAMKDIVGLDVKYVNVHIEDVSFDQ